MQNKKFDLFEKGNFAPMDNNFMTEGHEALLELHTVQEKYDKGDTDTFINELRDSITGYKLGFDLINTEKHGYDCKKTGDINRYLEVKAASFVSNTWQATFNDTTLEKAETFQDKKLFLALSVWKNASDLMFICFGQNKKLGEFLYEKVEHFLGGNTVRSTQSIGLSRLIFEYDFRILIDGDSRSRKDVLDILKLKSRSFNKLKEEDLIIQSEFTNIEDYF